MGEPCRFEELQPGSYLNLNRSTGSGHAVLFLNYLDKAGNDLATYSDEVKGFKYYSSQGSEANGGFDYRWAFFGDLRPTLPDGRKRDCNVIRSTKRAYLNTGHMWMPGDWDVAIKDAAISRMATRAPGEENEVNPAYVDQMTTDDI